MSGLFPDLSGHWYASYRCDPVAAALYRRHYSASKDARAGKIVTNFMGPGETLVLVTASCDAVFAWQRNVGAPRLDKQKGVCCTIFRNEGADPLKRVDPGGRSDRLGTLARPSALLVRRCCQDGATALQAGSPGRLFHPCRVVACRSPLDAWTLPARNPTG